MEEPWVLVLQYLMPSVVALLAALGGTLGAHVFTQRRETRQDRERWIRDAAAAALSAIQEFSAVYQRISDLDDFEHLAGKKRWDASDDERDRLLKTLKDSNATLAKSVALMEIYLPAPAARSVLLIRARFTLRSNLALTVPITGTEGLKKISEVADDHHQFVGIVQSYLGVKPSRATKSGNAEKRPHLT